MPGVKGYKRKNQTGVPRSDPGYRKAWNQAKSATGRTNWGSMVSRCTHQWHKAYPQYGGRGITVYEGWLGDEGFQRFIAHIGPKPSPKHQIDRIDNTGGYVPGNVRWVLCKENLRNRSITILLTARGETKSMSEWSEITGIPWATLRARLKLGWTHEEAIYGLGPADGRAVHKRYRLREILSGLKVGDSTYVGATQSSVHLMKKLVGIQVKTSVREEGLLVTRTA